MTQTSDGATRHWDLYWGAQGAPQRSRGGREAAAVTGAAPGDRFDGDWRRFFDDAFAGRKALRFADLACGAGVVLARAVDCAVSAGCEQALFCGLDYSQHAALKITKSSARRPAYCVRGVGASVDKLPFPDRSFDLVASQFGLEYAGVTAFSEAARILAPGGGAQFIVHYKDGGIDRECRENFQLLRETLDSGLFKTATSVFSDDEPKRATARLERIFKTLTPRLQGDPTAAKGLLSQLLRDISRLVSRRGAYDRQEAIAWLAAMHEEVRQYRARMGAMNAAALGESEIAVVLNLISEQGVATDTPEALTIENAQHPAAWRLTLRRGG